MVAREIIFIGSSVCVGSGAVDNRGWSALLSEHLESNGWHTSNCAIGGQTTTDILLRLDRDVIQHHPEICIVGLGLANEGLAKTYDISSARIVQGIFEHNLKMIVTALQTSGIRTMLGGVYPNNHYTEFQYKVLKETDEAMATWGIPVFRWLTALDDGNGHFREGLYHDAGHPNDHGYRVMYEQIPDTFIL